MACQKLITFDFVEGNYIMKMTQQGKDFRLTYRNELNVLSFPKFTAMDFNIFFTICYYASNHYKKYGMKKLIRSFKNEFKKDYDEKDDINFVEIKFDDLRIFMPQIKNKKRFFNEIYDLVKYKLRFVGVDRIKSTLGQVDKGKFLPFFYEFDVDNEEELLRVKITSYAYSLLNEFGNFMSFDMNEFCSFENKYTKTLFRLLKQYENSNAYIDEKNPHIKAITMSKDEFKKFMDTPDNYESKDLERKVIKPSIKEIKSKTSYFNGSTHKSYSIQMIDYEKIFEEYEKKDNLIQRKRRSVKGFKFIFEKMRF
ncbi:replication initiation protein, partial [Campylobacter upsaliensis]|nr:replication initiation protein [Campylobacter upsaliensis]EDA5019173.1 replication initiation protein [Campylobacter upsaliensis]EGH3929488.1 replication initiation protein [Campylobacter upsaliensis]